MATVLIYDSVRFEDRDEKETYENHYTKYKMYCLTTVHPDGKEDVEDYFIMKGRAVYAETANDDGIIMSILSALQNKINKSNGTPVSWMFDGSEEGLDLARTKGIHAVTNRLHASGYNAEVSQISLFMTGKIDKLMLSDR